jgi:glycerophosphoryl diester phosphodiesterase
MPEGDTIAWAANRIRPILAGRVPDEIMILPSGERWVVELDGPVLELMTEGRSRFDQRPSKLGPDVLAPQFDAQTFLGRLRAEASRHGCICAMASRVPRCGARIAARGQTGGGQPHDILVSGMSTMSGLRRVGHKGADLIAPGNTLASFDAALEAGVDVIEFDVLADSQTGRLLLAHDHRDAAARAPHTLEEGLAHLASAPFDGVELDVDLKLPGYELEVVRALRAHGVLERSLISTQYRSSLRLIRSAEPELRLGWSVPKLRRDPFRSRATAGPALVALMAMRLALPHVAARAISSGLCDALMAHWRLVTARLARAVRRAGGELYVWTVDEPSLLSSMQRLGVTGVITNDPRLFSG